MKQEGPRVKKKSVSWQGCRGWKEVTIMVGVRRSLVVVGGTGGKKKSTDNSGQAAVPRNTRGSGGGEEGNSS